jgi:threonylcarbamoyladenosine tRNA methylthiotransferase MtaB
VSVSRSKTRAGAGRYALTCLGCKVNQAEAAYLCSRLEAVGFQAAEADEPAELALVMTCAVTAAAARQSRQAVRRMAKGAEHARIVATGCAVQAEPQAYLELGCTVLGRSRLTELEAMVLGQIPWPGQSLPSAPDAGDFCPGLTPIGPGRSRAQLKVQDGCDAHCAYCIVPSTRGNPRSLPPDLAVQGFVDLARAGAPEVVLTGIHLGMYGKDLGLENGVLELVRALLQCHPGPRIRLSSLEVNEVSGPLLDLMAKEKRLCNHLHIPLQSGSNQVLAAMGRPYTREQFSQTVTDAVNKISGLCVGADVLVGLPGEDRQAFEDTRQLIIDLPISHLHVFPYSPRPGTRAVEMPGRPKGPEVKERAASLRKLGGQKRLAFHQAQVGKRLSAIVELGGQARSGNYCMIELDQKLAPGSAVEVLIEGVKLVRGQPLLRGKLTG